MKAAAACAAFIAAIIGFSAVEISLAACIAYITLAPVLAPVYPAAAGLEPPAGGFSIDMALPIRPLAAAPGASPAPAAAPSALAPAPEIPEMVLII